MTPLVISHRGAWWPDRDRENTLSALAAAFAAGQGVEVDVRQFRGDTARLVLSHDPLPEGSEWTDGDDGSLPSWDAFLDLAYQTDPSLPILINVKEPGTETRLAWDLQAWGLQTRAYLFDFELCGADPLKAKATAPEVPCLVRVSDQAGTGVAPDVVPTLPHWARGAWIDPWISCEWATAELIALWQTLGPVFIVAPDLHGRPFDFKLLDRWRGADGVCTDLGSLVGPWLAGQPELFPANVWWGE